MGVEVPLAVPLLDHCWTELVSPPLSVVRQPIDMLVLHSVEPGVGRLRGALTDPRHFRVNAEFVRRSSAAPAPFTHQSRLTATTAP
jgi:LacI family transcriptional regulator